MQARENFITQLANEARDIVTPYFRSDYDVETKSDKSPVTEADRAVEKTIRTLIEQTYPDDGIIGEEFGVKDSKNGYDWVIDPIDGTRPFMLGLAHFTTLIALTKDTVPVLGCIDQPILKDRWVGDGQVTEYNDQKSNVRSTRTLKEAVMCSTAPGMFMTPDLDPNQEDWQKYARLKKQCKMMHWGGDAMLYAALASGRADIIIEADLGTYDFCALVPVVEGAGGIMTDWEGNQLTTQSDGHVLACATKELHEQALDVLNKS